MLIALLPVGRTDEAGSIIKETEMRDPNVTQVDKSIPTPPEILLTLLSLILFFPVQLLGAENPNEQCMACHEDQNLKNNEGRSLFVSRVDFERSIHGESGITCVSCHSDLEKVIDFPHAEKLVKVNCSACHGEAQKQFETSVHAPAKLHNKGQSVNCVSCHGYHDILGKTDVKSRTHPLNLPQTCGSCHFSKVNGGKGTRFVKSYLESVHALALRKAGLSSSATCVSCHGSHEIKPTEEPGSFVSRRQVPNTCGQCHGGILKDYREGVHGQAFAMGIREVPVCTDCHGEHNIRSPQDKQSKVYATQVPLTCVKCHDDDQLIQKYNLPKARLRTFRGTFHGVASSYGETKVANCASCHGFHNIRPSGDPKSSVNPSNLPETCGHCHPGVRQKFSKVKIHVVDLKAANYAGYIVKNFYFYFILALIGSFVLYILADLKARLLRRN